LTRGNRYLAGWLGKASVVGFPGEPDRFGNATFDLYVATPEPRDEPKPIRPTSAGREQDGPVGAPVGLVARREGWNGSRYRRPHPGAPAAFPAASYAPFDDTLEGIGR
jgi:hypothetical protein